MFLSQIKIALVKNLCTGMSITRYVTIENGPFEKRQRSGKEILTQTDSETTSSTSLVYANVPYYRTMEC